MSDLKPCPFCGEIPEIDNNGTCIEFSCCVSIYAQKSDIIEEKTGSAHTFDFCMQTFKYLGDGEKVVNDEMIRRWNTRQPRPAIKAFYDELELSHILSDHDVSREYLDLMPISDVLRLINSLMGAARAIKKAVEG